VASTASPSLLVAWLEGFIKEALERKETFLPSSPFAIEPVDFSFYYDAEEKLIKIELTFSNKDEDEFGEIEVSIEELSISGRLVQVGEGRITVEWEKGNGNSFWLTSLICALDAEIKVLG
jgi:hypothetical protein